MRRTSPLAAGALAISAALLGCAAPPPGEASTREALPLTTGVAELRVARYDVTTTTLGTSPTRILVVGGYANTAAAGIAVPPDVDLVTVSGATVTSKQAGSLLEGRYGHGAARLADGGVLVTGGYGAPNFGSLLSSAERFDVAANRWTAAAPMSTPRARHAAMLLPDGRVLVAGGYTGVDPANPAVLMPTSSAELYDPATNAWSKLPDMAEPRAGAVATLVGTTRVHFVGPGLTAESFDLTASKWTPAHPAPMPLARAVAVPLGDGRVFFAAGGDLSAAVYDPGADAWTPLPPIQANATGVFYGLAAGALLEPGVVLLAGGAFGVDVSSATPRSNAFVFDLATRQWHPASPLDTARARLAAVSLGDGTALVLGGSESRTVDRITRAVAGAACTFDGDCTSMHCADHVCCDRACDGKCERCDTATARGTCAAVTGAFNHCEVGNLCIAGACTPTAGTACSADRTSAIATNGVSIWCDDFRCDAATGACLTACASTDDCVPGATCDVAAKQCRTGAPPAVAASGCAIDERAEQAERQGRRGPLATAFAAFAIAVAVRRRRRAARTTAR